MLSDLKHIAVLGSLFVAIAVVAWLPVLAFIFALAWSWDFGRRGGRLW